MNILNILNDLRDFMNPNAERQKALYQRAEIFDRRMQEIDKFMRLVGGRARKLKCVLDKQAAPECSEQRVLEVSSEEMFLAMKFGFDTVYGLRLIER